MTQLLASVFESWGGGGTVFFYQTEPFEKCLYSSHHGVLLLQGSLSFLTLNDSALRLYISKKYHTMDLMDIFQTNVEHLRLILPRRPFCPMQWACGVHVVKIQSYITRGVCMYVHELKATNFHSYYPCSFYNMSLLVQFGKYKYYMPPCPVCLRSLDA